MRALRMILWERVSDSGLCCPECWLIDDRCNGVFEGEDRRPAKEVFG
jgi:hypothetical protein